MKDKPQDVVAQMNEAISKAACGGATGDESTMLSPHFLNKDKKVDFLSSSQEGNLKPQYCLLLLNGGSEVSWCVPAPPQRAASQRRVNESMCFKVSTEFETKL